jgi:hypothetical protein
MSSESLSLFTNLSVEDAQDNPAQPTPPPSGSESELAKPNKTDKPSIESNKESETCKKTKLPHTFRKSLSSSMSDRNKVSIWSILKQCVDKELYRFTIPIVWNEPLSLLQRMAENMRYSNMLLDKAAESTSPLDRIKYVAGFLVSCTSIHIARLSKPFNPLLGETYEYTSVENKYRICCEQVSHHPPVSAYYSESTRPAQNAPQAKKWKYYGSVNPNIKMNLLNACVEAFPFGIQTVEFPEHGETYTWHNLKVSIHKDNLTIYKCYFVYTKSLRHLFEKKVFKVYFHLWLDFHSNFLIRNLSLVILI